MITMRFTVSSFKENKIKETKKHWKQQHHQECIEYYHKYYREHHEERLTLQKKIRWRNKVETLKHYSGGEPYCVCCGEKELKFLTLDHINNDGHKLGRQSDSLIIPIGVLISLYGWFKGNVESYLGGKI